MRSANTQDSWAPSRRGPTIPLFIQVISESYDFFLFPKSLAYSPARIPSLLSSASSTSCFSTDFITPVFYWCPYPRLFSIFSLLSISRFAPRVYDICLLGTFLGLFFRLQVSFDFRSRETCLGPGLSIYLGQSWVLAI